MQWTDRIRSVKIVLVVIAAVIAVVSLLVSHTLVRDLSNEERGKMEIWAQALDALNNADENTDVSLVLEVLQGNNTIPVIVLDKDNNVMDYRNIAVRGADAADSLEYIAALGKKMHDRGRYIRINFGTGNAEYQTVCYDDSILLKRLATYPYIQLAVVLIFVIVAIFALLSSKRAEQNKVWVGLSKETAHQLGTPISSLMAWVEVLKENYPDDPLIPEMGEDVRRLELIAERFSKIGSMPCPEEEGMNDVMEHAIEYIRRRTSKKVQITYIHPDGDMRIKMCPQLFEWVIENLCKNAVDAMEGDGRITVTVCDEERRILIDVADTGKGIRRKDISNVFKPGFTTKKRGWGLGLSLAKRIIEDYHKGKIYVKSTEVGRGTTFRIELKKT